MTDPKSDRPTLTTADLDRLDALLREAAPGPLVVKALPRMYSSGIDTWLVVNTATNDVCASQFDYGNPGGPLAHLIAAAINALPALLRLARLGLAVEEAAGRDSAVCFHCGGAYRRRAFCPTCCEQGVPLRYASADYRHRKEQQGEEVPTSDDR